MQDLKLSTPSRSLGLMGRTALPGQARTLQKANQSALAQLGAGSDTPGDPKGRVLRHLRLQQGIDPSSLATRACMSLSQLYELENGGHSRFYSESLRRQAGRRVAKLLGADWDDMEMAPDRPAQVTSNVVHLPHPAHQHLAKKSDTPANHPSTQSTADTSTNHLSDDLCDKATAHDDSPVGLGLSAPASETLLVQAPPAQTSTSQAKKKFLSGWRTVLTAWSMFAAAAGIYLFAQYSPYRLYWPW